MGSQAWLVLAVFGAALCACFGFSAWYVVKLRFSLAALQERVGALEGPKSFLVPPRYVSPEVSDEGVYTPDGGVYADVDVVGAWALEQERAGRVVNDTVLEEQRRLWREFGG